MALVAALAVGLARKSGTDRTLESPVYPMFIHQPGKALDELLLKLVRWMVKLEERDAQI